MFQNGLDPNSLKKKEQTRVRKTTGSCRFLVTLTIFSMTTVQNYIDSSQQPNSL